MTHVFGRAIIAALATVLVAGCGVAEPPVAFSPVVVEQPAASTRPGTTATPVGVPPVVPAAAPVPTQVLAVGPELRIASVPNFRDVAGDGAGLLLTDGTRMTTGVVYRSGKLQRLSTADKARLVAAGITGIYDLRTPTVAKASPDPSIRGAKRQLVNIFAVKRSPAAKPRSVAAAQVHMKSVNRAFVSKAAQRRATAIVLRGIARAKGPVIVHCTEGKDRTGWVTALLQLTAGASERTVITEYLLSNSYRKALIDSEVAKVRKAKGSKAAAIQKVLLTVDASYLKAGLSELKKRYGSFDGYLTKGLGLDRPTIAALRARFRPEGP